MPHIHLSQSSSMKSAYSVEVSKRNLRRVSRERISTPAWFFRDVQLNYVSRCKEYTGKNSHENSSVVTGRDKEARVNRRPLHRIARLVVFMFPQTHDELASLPAKHRDGTIYILSSELAGNDVQMACSPSPHPKASDSLGPPRLHPRAYWASAPEGSEKC